MGINQRKQGEVYNVYIPDNIKKYAVFKPNEKAVPDVLITDELWIVEPVKLKKVGTVTAIKDAMRDGIPFTYGDGKKAELYEWEYKFNKNVKERR